MINVILAAAAAALIGSAPGSAASASGPAPAETVLAPSRARACVEAFSKNICDSSLTSAFPEFDGCGHTCRTLFVPDASWRLPLKQNVQNCVQCSGPGSCDETPRLDSTVVATIQYTLRLNGPCSYRGCFEGRWQLQSADGITYSGRVSGTMGVGTHRFNSQCCETSADRTCERCLDVEFIPNDDATTGTWRIGVEGTFDGSASSTEPIPDHLHFSFSGDLLAPGDLNGPYFSSDTFTWRFNGTADGIHADYCN